MGTYTDLVSQWEYWGNNQGAITGLIEVNFWFNNGWLRRIELEPVLINNYPYSNDVNILVKNAREEIIGKFYPDTIKLNGYPDNEHTDFSSFVKITNGGGGDKYIIAGRDYNEYGNALHNQRSDETGPHSSVSVLITDFNTLAHDTLELPAEATNINVRWVGPDTWISYDNGLTIVLSNHHDFTQGALKVGDLVYIPNVTTGGYTLGTDDSDNMFGTDADDRHDLGSGHDSINSGAGHDVVLSGAGEDQVEAGAGDDYVTGNQGSDVISAGDGHDWVYAGKDADTVTGGQGNDVLSGDNGNDLLHGGKGSDNIEGGNGDDTISGDMGKDYALGGEGSDTFKFAAGHGTDAIGDFVSGRDHILLIGLTYQVVPVVANDIYEITLQTSDGGTIDLLGVTSIQPGDIILA